MGYPFSRNRWLKGFKGSQLFVSFTISCVSATSSAVRASKMKSCSNFIIGQAVRVRTLDGKEHTAIQCATARAVRKGQGECETRYTGFFFFPFLFFAAWRFFFIFGGDTPCVYVWYIFSLYMNLWFIQKFNTDLEFSISNFPHSAAIFTRKNQFTFRFIYYYVHTHTRTSALVGLKHFVVNFHLSVSYSSFFLYYIFCFFGQKTKNVLNDRQKRHTLI